MKLKRAEERVLKAEQRAEKAEVMVKRVSELGRTPLKGHYGSPRRPSKLLSVSDESLKIWNETDHSLAV